MSCASLTSRQGVGTCLLSTKRRLSICLVGGIYGKDEVFRSRHTTPEITLECGFKSRGHEVRTFSHYSPFEGKQFDVIHVHHLSYGAIRAAVANDRAAFVYTSHDGPAMEGLPNSVPRRVGARFVMSRADAVVALSKKEADFQQRTYLLLDAVHSVIPNGIDLTNYCYARHNPAGKGRPWQLLYVGQLIELKKVEVLLRALVRVHQPVELALAYHNPAMEAPLKKLASDLGLGHRVRFLGRKPPSELARLYQQADLFVLPSAGEALPSVITEAMACGTPVVATDVGGVREQLGGHGVIIRLGQVNELAAAIRQVLDHYEQFAARGEAMSQYARQRFSAEGMVDRHLELYTELANRKGARRRHVAFRMPLNAVLKMGLDLACATK